MAPKVVNTTCHNIQVNFEKQGIPSLTLDTKLRQLEERSGFTDRKSVQGAAGRAPLTVYNCFPGLQASWIWETVWREINQAEFITLYVKPFLSMNMDILLSLLGVIYAFRIYDFKNDIFLNSHKRLQKRWPKSFNGI